MSYFNIRSMTNASVVKIFSIKQNLQCSMAQNPKQVGEMFCRIPVCNIPGVIHNRFQYHNNKKGGVFVGEEFEWVKLSFIYFQMIKFID